MPSWGRTTAVGCALAVLIAACASEARPQDEVFDVARVDGPVSEHLKRLPGDDGTIIVNYSDIARAADIAGLERPDDTGELRAVERYLFEVSGSHRDGTARVGALLPAVANVPGSLGERLEGFVDEVGWSMLDVDSFVERDTLPRRISVLEGTFDQDRLDDALGDAEDGVWVLGDPEGRRRKEEMSPARPIGESLWLALEGDRLIVTRVEDDMVATRRMPAGANTLADHETLASLAAALDDRGVYAARLLAADSLASGLHDRTLLDSDRIDALGVPQCEGIIGYAVGVADDGGPLVVLAFANADAASADANAGTLADVLRDGVQIYSRQPWKDVLTVETVETYGRTVVVTARTADLILADVYELVVNDQFPPC